MLVTYARQNDPRFLQRADPAYWHPAYETLLQDCRYPLQPLGDFIRLLTYGPIITGQRPPVAARGVALINQGQIGAAGVTLAEAHFVPKGCPWDIPRARLLPGDLVIARSGIGSLAKNRLAVFYEETPAVVGSFVDLVRLEGLEPVYAALYLKTRFGWGQIHRLINGVATPNISFDEIRCLQIALLPRKRRQEFQTEYMQQVLPRHRCSDVTANEIFAALVKQLEDELGPVPQTGTHRA